MKLSFKSVATLACLWAAPFANTFAQKVHNQTHIDMDSGYHEHDNGKTLEIKISGSKNGKTFYFEKTYNIKGMSRMQVDSIKKHVTDSLSVK